MWSGAPARRQTHDLTQLLRRDGTQAVRRDADDEPALAAPPRPSVSNNCAYRCERSGRSGAVQQWWDAAKARRARRTPAAASSSMPAALRRGDRCARRAPLDRHTAVPPDRDGHSGTRRRSRSRPSSSRRMPAQRSPERVGVDAVEERVHRLAPRPEESFRFRRRAPGSAGQRRWNACEWTLGIAGTAGPASTSAPSTLAPGRTASIVPDASISIATSAAQPPGRSADRACGRALNAAALARSIDAANAIASGVERIHVQRRRRRVFRVDEQVSPSWSTSGTLPATRHSQVPAASIAKTEARRLIVPASSRTTLNSPRAAHVAPSGLKSRTAPS